MGHRTLEAMCTATKSCTRQNIKLTVKQVCRAMNPDLCLSNILSNKNKPKIQDQ